MALTSWSLCCGNGMVSSIARVCYRFVHGMFICPVQNEVTLALVPERTITFHWNHNPHVLELAPLLNRVTAIFTCEPPLSTIAHSFEPHTLKLYKP